MFLQKMYITAIFHYYTQRAVKKKVFCLHVYNENNQRIRKFLKIPFRKEILEWPECHCGWMKMEILEQIREKTYPSQIQQDSLNGRKRFLSIESFEIRRKTFADSRKTDTCGWGVNI